MQKGTPTLDEIRAHFAGFAHSQDAPAIFFWEKLLEAYPNAKIVMTTREFESWHKSVLDTIGKLLPGSPNPRPFGVRVTQALIPRLRRQATMVGSVWTLNPKFLNGDLSKESFKRFYEKWY